MNGSIDSEDRDMQGDLFEDVTVVLPARNCREALERCLREYAAVRPDRSPSGDPDEPDRGHPGRAGRGPALIVVDDGSTDGTVQMLRGRWPAVTVLALSAHTGYAHAANAGLRLVRTDFAFLLRPDLQPSKHCLGELLSALREEPEETAFCAVPVFVPDNGRHPAKGRGRRADAAGAGGAGKTQAGGRLETEGRKKPRPENHGRRGEPRRGRRPVETAAVPDGCALYRMRVLEETGWFDERHFDGLEAFDLSLRAALSGFRTLRVPGAAVRPRPLAARKNALKRTERSAAGECALERAQMPGAAAVVSAGAGTPELAEKTAAAHPVPSAAGMFRRRLAAGNAFYLFYKNLPGPQRLLWLPFFAAADAAQAAAFRRAGEAEAYRMAVTRGRALCSLDRERRAAFADGISVYPENLAEASFLGMDEAAERIYPLFLAQKEPALPARIPQYLHIQRLLARDLSAWTGILYR